MVKNNTSSIKLVLPEVNWNYTLCIIFHIINIFKRKMIYLEIIFGITIIITTPFLLTWFGEYLYRKIKKT